MSDDMSDVNGRNFLWEARQILDGGSLLLVEKRHLEAIADSYEVRLIRISNQLEQLKKDVLNG